LVSKQPGPNFCTEHPKQIEIDAIQPLAGEGGAATANSGESAALPAGLDQRLT
jgi:hypothetical protein